MPLTPTRSRRSPAPDAHDRLPGRELALLFATATLLRIALAGAAMWFNGWSLEDLAALRDGKSYTNVASSLLGRPSELTSFDLRVFVGYPALIAVAAAPGLSTTVAALVLNWFAAGAAAVLAALLFHSRRIGWMMAVAVPSYIMYSTVAMNEATQLALVLGGVLCVASGWPIAGGILLGVGGLVRPVACFAVLGVLFAARSRPSFRSAVIAAAVSGATVAGGVMLYRQWRGDIFENIRLYATHKDAYAGRMFDWPFLTLVQTPLVSPTPLHKTVYIWAHVAVVLGGCMLLWRRWRATGDPDRHLTALAFAWLITHTLFTVCIGRYWGFHEFHRFILPALPALLWAYHPFIPRRAPFIASLSAVSVLLAAVAINNT